MADEEANKLTKWLDKMFGWQTTPFPLQYIDLGNGIVLTKIAKAFAFLRRVRPVLIMGVVDQATGKISFDGVSAWHGYWSAVSGTNWADMPSGWPVAQAKYFAKYNMTDAVLMAPKTAQIVTSAAMHTLTAAAGHTYVVWHMSSRNNTRPPQFQVNMNDGTTGVIPYDTGAGLNASQMYSLLPGIITDQGAESPGGMHAPIILQPGASLANTDAAFVAADVRRTDFIYTDITN